MFENYTDVEWAISSQVPLKWKRFNDYPKGVEKLINYLFFEMGEYCTLFM